MGALSLDSDSHAEHCAIHAVTFAKYFQIAFLSLRFGVVYRLFLRFADGSPQTPPSAITRVGEREREQFKKSGVTRDKLADYRYRHRRHQFRLKPPEVARSQSSELVPPKMRAPQFVQTFNAGGICSHLRLKKTRNIAYCVSVYSRFILRPPYRLTEIRLLRAAIFVCWAVERILSMRCCSALWYISRCACADSSVGLGYFSPG